MSQPCRAVAVFAALFSAALSSSLLGADSAHWPAWRGPHGNGHSDESGIPVNWDETKNVVWKQSVPGRGHSSPVVFGNVVALTTADEDKQEQSILAYDFLTGEPLWQRVAHRGGFMHNHKKNSQASATPICDGESIYAVFINGGGLHVTATDLDGEVRWQNKVGNFDSEHGYGSSPVLYKSLVIVNGESLKGSFLAGVDSQTGETAWITPCKNTGRHGGFATPIVRNIAGRDQLLLMGIEHTSSYDPGTGKQLWTCKGPAEVNAGTVVTHGDLVIASGGYPEKEVLAIRADGSGDVSNTHVAWRVDQGVTYVPTPIVYEDRIYMINDGGIATCLDAGSGKQIWKGRLPGKFSASPTLAGGHLYVPDERGTTYVLEAGPTFKVVAENALGDGGFASPTICDGKMLLRTEHYLYCIAK